MCCARSETGACGGAEPGCTLAAHYFFEKKEMAETFLANVAEALEDGGCFYGTIICGKRVAALFGDKVTLALAHHAHGVRCAGPPWRRTEGVPLRPLGHGAPLGRGARRLWLRVLLCHPAYGSGRKAPAARHGGRPDGVARFR